jgi:integrase
MSARTHATRIATLLTMAGPRYSPRQRVAELLPRLPYVPPVEADFEPKPPYSLEQARQIAAGCGKLSRPQLPNWIGTELWWKVRLGLFYYTGLRAGTVVSLCWSHVEERGGYLWLKVPKALVKTRKAIELPCHEQLADLLRQARDCRPSDSQPTDVILPQACGYRHFVTLHSELQEAAGIAAADRQSPHAWRRTHLSQIGELGAFRGLEFSRVAADHADGRTTEQHYVTQLVNQLRLRLPTLF